MATLIEAQIKEEGRGDGERVQQLYRFSVDRKVLKGLYWQADSELQPEKQRERCRECQMLLEKQRPTNLLELHFSWMDKNNQLTDDERQKVLAFAGARINYDIRGFEERFEKFLRLEKSGERTFEDLLPMYKELGKLGVSAALVHIGRKYLDKKLQGDIDIAKNYFEQARELGNAEASYQLGIMYETGVGIGGTTEEVRKEKAKKFYKEASDRGHKLARGAYDRLNDSSGCKIA